MSNIPWEIVIAATAAMLGLLAILNTILMQRRIRNREIETQLLVMDKLRSSLERDVYGKTTALMSNPERWKEINHLLIDASKSIENSNNSNFLSNILGENYQSIPIKKDQVFILTPFHSLHTFTFEAISKACINLGLKPLRGDETNASQSILKHVLRNMIESEFVIANLDGRNPNVYYELGIAHSLGKSVILVASNIDDVAFDLQNNLIVVWKNEKELENSLNKAFFRHIRDSA